MIRAFQWDLARQVERLDFLKPLLPRYARWGYGELYLHLEDAVHYPSLPGIGRADAYTHAQLGELVSAASAAGIRVVPIVNLLGHTQYLISHPDLRDLNELRDEDGAPLPRGQICPLHPRLGEIAEKLLRDMAPHCTAGKVHVGLDESYHLGRCPRCRAEVARHGLGGHFARHARRLHEIVAGLGLEMGLWADMLYFVPEAIPQLPAGITAYDWYYYPFGRKPRVEFFNFAERDLQPTLRRRGIKYYGCPMNGAFRHEPLPVFGDRLANIRSWWQRCHAIGAEGLLVTSWEANRLAVETTTVVDAAAAHLWLEPGLDDATTLLARGLEHAGGSKHPRPQARALLAADAHAFAGYARWQINDRWDVFAGEEAVQPYAAEARFFARLRQEQTAWPPALAASLDFRRYLAERDVFVRRAAQAVFGWRRQLAKGVPLGPALRGAVSAADEFLDTWRAGRRAARAMWVRSRDPRHRGPNELLLDADRRRLRDWRAWLRRALRRPETVNQSTPVCGAWQLVLRVHNFAPAAQRVAVEIQGANGAWEELAARHTIEFRASAARPRARIVRHFSVPVSGPDQPLRVVVRGVGQVAISHVQLTDGVRVRRRKNWSRSQVVGRRAPAQGWPLDPAAAAILPLSF